MVFSPNPNPNTGYEDDWTNILSHGFWPKWDGGLIVPVALAVYGIICIVDRQGYLPGYYRSGMVLRETNAAMLAVAGLGAGLFLNFHYFWSDIYHLSGYATIDKIAGSLTFIVAFGSACMG